VHHQVEGLLLLIKENQLTEVNSVHLKSHPTAADKIKLYQQYFVSCGKLIS
jgi:hypothetical protein